MAKKRKKLRGTVEKVIKPIVPSQREKAQIEIADADPLYREIRIENAFDDDKGETTRLTPGTKVDVTVEEATDPTLKKPENS